MHKAFIDNIELSNKLRKLVFSLDLRDAFDLMDNLTNEQEKCFDDIGLKSFNILNDLQREIVVLEQISLRDADLVLQQSLKATVSKPIQDVLADEEWPLEFDYPHLVYLLG